MKYPIDLWEPVNALRNLGNVFPQVFGSETAENRLSPKVDILDKGSNLVLSAEFPGVSKEDLDIDVKDNRLTVRGEKKLEEKTEDGGYLRVERSYGNFERTFFLDDSIDKESIKANYKDGILTLVLPKKKEELSKKIEVG